MSDLALEIKKLADKYRNSKKTGLLDVDDFGHDDVSEVNLSTVSNDDSTDDFNSDRLDFLEQEVDDLSDLDVLEEEIESNEGGALTKEPVADSIFEIAQNDSSEDVVDDEQKEIQIADFINPSTDVVKNSDYDGVDVGENSEEIIEGNRGAVSESLRLISRNLRDLKALLRG